MKFFRELLKTLNQIESALDRIQQKMETNMATAQNFKDLVTLLNSETDALAAKIAAFIAGQQAGGLTAAEEDAALADLQAVADRLKTLGSDPANPIPPVV